MQNLFRVSETQENGEVKFSIETNTLNDGETSLIDIADCSGLSEILLPLILNQCNGRTVYLNTPTCQYVSRDYYLKYINSTYDTDDYIIPLTEFNKKEDAQKAIFLLKNLTNNIKNTTPNQNNLLFTIPSLLGKYNPAKAEI